MGCRPNAYLFFGSVENNPGDFICKVSDEMGEDYYADADADIEEYIAIKFGLELLPHDLEYAGNEQRFSAQWKKKGEILKNLPCEVGRCGSADIIDYFVAIKYTFKSADWDDPVEINDRIFVQKPSWVPSLDTFCKTIGFDYKPPKWHLAAYYG